MVDLVCKTCCNVDLLLYTRELEGKSKVTQCRLAYIDHFVRPNQCWSNADPDKFPVLVLIRITTNIYNQTAKQIHLGLN